MAHPRRLLMVLVALAAAVALAACGRESDSSGEIVFAGPSDFRGVRQLPALPLPDVTLIDTGNRPFRLRAEAAGKFVLLYTGYTNCPDVCPLQLAEVARALDQLPEAIASQVMVVFVTTDPERDTPTVLRKWLDRFDPGFVGLTGTQEQIEAVQLALNANPATKQALEGGGCTVDHAAYVLAFTPERQEADLVYPPDMSWQDYATDLRTLIEDGKRPK